MTTTAEPESAKTKTLNAVRFHSTYLANHEKQSAGTEADAYYPLVLTTRRKHEP